MGIFDFLKRKTANKAVFCGLDSSGKSTFISFLKTGTFISHTPTMGKKMEDLEINGTKITLFDMGGQSDFRDMWLGEINKAKCVVFVVDKADPARFNEAKGELEKILPTIEKNNINLLILANKHDSESAVNLSELIKALNLFAIQNFEIVEISAKTGYSIANAITKFYGMLVGSPIAKVVFAKAVSLYDSNGTPLIVKTYDNSHEDEIKDGFDSVIQTLGKINVATNEMQIIPRKNGTNGTFMIACSPNYIGSILWDESLTPVTQEQSEESLKSLLIHLEKVGDVNDKKEIKKFAEHYITNIL